MSRFYWAKRMRVFKRYDEEVTDGEDKDVFLRKLALTHVHAIRHEATRQSLAASLDRGDIRALCDFSPSYWELTAVDAWHARMVSGFFAKRDDLDLGVDRTAVARQKFLEAELACKQTNAIFRSWSSGRFQFHPDVEGVLHAASRKISEILGDVPSLAELGFRFGPGATTLRKKKDAHPRYKLGDAFACSTALSPVVEELLAEFPTWSAIDAADGATSPVAVMPGKVQFVPKSWKTKRSIVVNPPLNVVYQLGIGDYLARRLKEHGIDLRSQAKNQRLARYGSLTGALATLDLSSASDTISTELVAHLLPYDWYSFLSYGRTPYVKLGKDVLRLEKFSSMGDGFTFPLETLIFYALAASCCHRTELDHVTVYGDDIIVPVHRYQRLTKVLHACGFTVNPDKSFFTGAFRESCGKDYLLGQDIRPYYQKGPWCCRDAFKLHNYYVRRGDTERAALVLKTIAKHLQIFGPDGYGDGHLIGDVPLKPHRRDDGWGGYTFDTFVLGSRCTLRLSRGDHVWPSYTIYARNRECYLPVTYDDDVYAGKARIPGFTEQVLSSFVSPDRKGRHRVTLPGTSGYKRISIYTLSAGSVKS